MTRRLLLRYRAAPDVSAGGGGVVDPASLTWTLKNASAPMKPRDGGMVIYLAATGKYWLFGGWDDVNASRTWYPYSTTNEIWSSPDKITWTLEKAFVLAPAETGAGARWVKRHFGNCFKHTYGGTEYVYIIGGDHLSPSYDAFGNSPSNGYQSDVWRSSDGTTWERVCTSDAAPWAGRMFTVAGSALGALWVFGGQNGLLGGPPYPFTNPVTTTVHNDVYKSVDGGATWTQVAADGAIVSYIASGSASRPGGRGMVSKLVELNGRLWLIGGGTYDTANIAVRSYYAEVWSTVDGITWTQHAAPPWVGREYHSVEVFGGRIFMIGGYRLGAGPGGNLADVWSTADGTTWYSHPVGPWTPGHADGLCAGPDGLVHVTGNGTLQDLVVNVYTLTA